MKFFFLKTGSYQQCKQIGRVQNDGIKKKIKKEEEERQRGKESGDGKMSQITAGRKSPIIYECVVVVVLPPFGPTNTMSRLRECLLPHCFLAGISSTESLKTRLLLPS